MAIMSSPSYAFSNTILLWLFQEYIAFLASSRVLLWNPSSHWRPCAPLSTSEHFHLTLRLLSPACICTGLRTQGGSPRLVQQQKPRVLAAPPKRRSVCQPSPGNICNSVLPLGSLTRALLMTQWWAQTTAESWLMWPPRTKRRLVCDRNLTLLKKV